MDKELLNLRIVEAILNANHLGFVGLENALYQVAATLNEVRFVENHSQSSRLS